MTSSEPASGYRRALLLWGPPVATMAVVSISLSLSIPLFALLLTDLGVSALGVGLNHTVASLAMVATSLVLPRVLQMVGLLPLMIGSIGLLVVATLAIPLWESALWWGVIRLAYGIAGTALFFASEYWLISTAPEATRGRIVGIYVIVLSACYMLGPLLLNALGTEGIAIYATAAAIFLSAALPILLGRRHAPATEQDDQRPGLARLFRFFRSDPIILWGCVLFGLIEFGGAGLLTVWGLASGFDRADAVLLIFWLSAGSLCFQLPVGWAADVFDRRRLIAGLGFACLVAPLAVFAMPREMVWISAAMFVWGGSAVAIYSVALTELGSRYRGGALAAGNAAVIFAYGLGALLGPTLFGGAMDAAPPDGLFWVAATVGGAYATLCVLRIAFSRNPTTIA